MLEEEAQLPAGCQTVSGGPSGEDYEADSHMECHSAGVSVTTLGDATPAVLNAAKEFTAVTWMVPLESYDGEAFGDLDNPELEITLIGPAEAFPPDIAMEAADRV